MDTNTRVAAQGFVEYINASPTPYHAVANVKSWLTSAGFEVLNERDSWALEAGKKYVVTRNGSSLIAFKIGSNFSDCGPIAIVGAHTDSPCLKLKPISKKSGEGFIQVGIEQYGGLISHSWFDRDLALAGRVYVKTEDGKFEPRLLHIKKPLMRIPTLAIHLHREANTKFEFNKETEFVPIAGQEKFSSCSDDPNLKLTESEFEAVKHVIQRHNESLIQLIASELGVKPLQIEDFELLLCDYQDATLGGLNEEFIFGPRQDNLTSCYAATQALIESEPATNGVSLISLFDHEEIGSVSAQGADSSFLPDILLRIAKSDNGLMARICSQSFVISSDQAHGIHPNYERFYEKANRPHVNGGPVIKINSNQRYATNSRGIVLIKAIAEKSKVPMQMFVVRNDSPCGSTIGPMLSAKLGIRVLDLGSPQLSMHSIRETGGSHDILRLQKLFSGFFQHFADIDQILKCD